MDNDINTRQAEQMKKSDYPEDALAPGYLLLWYRIEGVLGEGGFGMTYLAHDVNLDRKVAIKEYLPREMCRRNSDLTISAITSSMDDYETGLSRFIREARTLAKFEHKNVVKVSNVFEENNTAYMVMAYEKGKDLKTLLTPKKTINEDHILSILLPIIEGLEYVHNEGFIHRDIKPGNIMIRQDGSPVLIDFGSVHDVKKSKANVTTLVSPGYTPHEQYLGKSELQGPWIDIYSLAATTYRCISGINPVDAIARGSSIIKQQGDPLIPARAVGEGKYSEHFLDAIDHALAFNETDRPQNLSEWREELTGAKTTTKGKKTKENVFEDTLELDLNSVKTVKNRHSKSWMLAASIAIFSILIFFNFPSEENELENPNQITKNIDQPDDTNQKTETDVVEVEEVISKTETVELAELVDQLKDGSQAPILITLPLVKDTIGGNEEDQDKSDDELPQRQIKLTQRLAIGKTEVTVSQFKQFVSATGYLTEAERQPNRGCRTFLEGWDWRPGLSWRNPGYEQTDNHPVVCVSWNDANAYVNWLSEQTGQQYSLPSEAVWELAARAGTTTTRFWGDSRACDYANVSDFSRAAMHNLNITSNNIFPCEDGHAYTAEVASYSVNDFGLHDMLGNVWEWTNDCWNDSYLQINEDGSSRLTGNCNNRVYRGGSWGNLPSLVRSSKRLTDPMEYRYYNVGFRVSRQIDS